MDQIKIGKFISTKRKEKNITQSELAEMLNITDRAISKWENGICLPDANNIIELCKILDITVNDLFSGEVVDMKDNEIRLEENLLEMTRLKEQKDKMLLTLEWVIGIIVSVVMFSLILIAAFVDMQEWLKIVLIITGIIPFMIGMFYALKIEQVAGYYECADCHHKYIPTYKSVFLAQHMGRTRKMTCPKCGKKTWNKKVLK
jgi:transcriptional regulator with XRE-family HTH domain/DNA-directed RNA polymerase subunit RPC12/RpoP